MITKLSNVTVNFLINMWYSLNSINSYMRNNNQISHYVLLCEYIYCHAYNIFALVNCNKARRHTAKSAVSIGKIAITQKVNRTDRFILLFIGIISAHQVPRNYSRPFNGPDTFRHLTCFGENSNSSRAAQRLLRLKRQKPRKPLEKV